MSPMLLLMSPWLFTLVHTIQSVIHVNYLLFYSIPYCLSPASKEVIPKARDLVCRVQCCIFNTGKCLKHKRGSMNSLKLIFFGIFFVK